MNALIRLAQFLQAQAGIVMKVLSTVLLLRCVPKTIPSDWQVLDPISECNIELSTLRNAMGLLAVSASQLGCPFPFNGNELMPTREWSMHFNKNSTVCLTRCQAILGVCSFHGWRLSPMVSSGLFIVAGEKSRTGAAKPPAIFEAWNSSDYPSSRPQATACGLSPRWCIGPQASYFAAC